MNIDPWASEQIFDYSKLFSEFGLSKLDEKLLRKLDFYLANRKILFAHRDLDSWISAAEKGEEIAIVSGIKPSSEFHLGSKLTADQIIFFQKKFNAKAFYVIADLESYADNGLSLEQSHQFAISNLADLLALGFDEKKAYIYKQSEEKRVMQMAHLFSRRTTFSMLKAIYGERSPSLYFSALIQVGDILLPQHKDFGGPKKTLVPVGVDQDPHIRFSRDIAFKERLQLPSSTYHKILRNLKGESKMSKRDSSSTLSLSDSLEEAKKKLMSILTGGRNTAEEQRKYGGEIEKCVLFEIMQAHFLLDEKQLLEMVKNCTEGKILCGECKIKYVEIVLNWLKSHQQKKQKMIDKAIKILEQK